MKTVFLIGKKLSIIPNPILKLLWYFTQSSECKIAIFIRYIYICKHCKQVGSNVFVGKYVTLKNIENLSIGNNVSIHAYNYIDAYGGIEIGNDVSIANHTSIISFDHTWSDLKKPIKYNPVKIKPITIKDDVWVSSGVRILGDTIIESRTIIAAGSVVTKSTNKNGIYAGVPNKLIKEI